MRKTLMIAGVLLVCCGIALAPNPSEKEAIPW